MSEVDDITLALTGLSRKLGDQSVDKDQRQVRAIIEEFMAEPPGEALQAISANMTQDATAHDMMCDIIHNMTPAGQMAGGAEAKAAFEVSCCGLFGQLGGDKGAFWDLPGTNLFND